MADQFFSKRLSKWLNSDRPKTLGSLESVFGEKGFGIAFLFLLGPSALPIPTAGITHIFEIVSMLLALELIIGRRVIWLPKRWRQINMGKLVEQKLLPFLMRRIKWLEKFSRPRLAKTLGKPPARSLTGLFIFILALSSFIAPPFSGLDTLPSLGAVIISLAIILEDVLLYIAGVLIGAIGVGVMIGLGSAVFKLVI